MGIDAVPLNRRNLVNAYGWALDIAGIHFAKDHIEDLLEPTQQEKFCDFYPDEDLFPRFCKRFDFAKNSVMDAMKWEFNRNQMSVAPSHEQTIRDYFLNVFKSSITSASAIND